MDFGLVVSESRAAQPALGQPADRRAMSPEWTALRLTLEHLVYFTSRLQVFLSAALGDEYIMAQGSWRSRFRFPYVRPGGSQEAELAAVVKAWRRLLARQVRRRDRRRNSDSSQMRHCSLLAPTLDLQKCSLPIWEGRREARFGGVA